MRPHICKNKKLAHNRLKLHQMREDRVTVGELREALGKFDLKEQTVEFIVGSKKYYLKDQRVSPNRFLLFQVSVLGLMELILQAMLI